MDNFPLASTHFTGGSRVTAADQGEGVPLYELLNTLQTASRMTVVFSRVDLIAANAAVYYYVHRGPDATIDSIDSGLTGALAVGDATITAAINAVAVTGGVVTITQAGSGAGDVDQAVPSAANVLSAGDVLTLTVGGANTAAEFADVTVHMVH